MYMHIELRVYSDSKLHTHKHDTNHSHPYAAFMKFVLWYSIILVQGTKPCSIATGKPTRVPPSSEVCVGDCNLCRWLQALYVRSAHCLSQHLSLLQGKAHTHANTPKHRCRGNTVHGSVYYPTHVLRSRLILSERELWERTRWYEKRCLGSTVSLHV